MLASDGTAWKAFENEYGPGVESLQRGVADSNNGCDSHLGFAGLMNMELPIVMISDGLGWLKMVRRKDPIKRRCITAAISLLV